ncbi:hypothetical protein [Aphanothece sacrum]|uniref:Glycosyltransferase RgtA/B/C/D-like domain-containing protein n=1 Tax=Aphanothece sacrum FPU1 TaxID=1920663 RepID=A0A401IIF9_APHSA|nr:hypothetical protein [Aphanothece sacrum]GBF81044.1 hypothetical protein AsFPU1_2453 [Aphanothece sacrum FPU1]GBF85445.1 hypothetical protein AsFPU3_2504 [Aphanothece sacrum FPU3]
MRSDFWFVLAMWLLSRGLILIALLGLAPLLSAPPGAIQAQFGWDVFSAWDSNFYEQIATTGYEGIGNTPGSNVAFFPLFPLIIRGFMSLGLSAKVAGILINNSALLGTLFVLYYWVKRTNGIKAACWTTAILAWCPLSLFGTVVYTEGLFLLFSTLALSAFDGEHYKKATGWGILATATRITGLALIPAFLLTAWRRNSPISVYLGSLFSGGGVLLYSGYCWLNFHDPIAFITVQHTQWQRKQGFDWEGWTKMFGEITLGIKNWEQGSLQDPLHPLLFLLISILAYGLWHYRHRLGIIWFDYGFFTLFFLLWLLVGDPLLNTLFILGGICLLWQLRYEMNFVAFVYGLCALGLLLSSGGTISLNRLAYGIISLSLALGILVSQYTRWGYAILIFFTLLLMIFSVRFAQHQWVA